MTEAAPAMARRCRPLLGCGRCVVVPVLLALAGGDATTFAGEAGSDAAPVQVDRAVAADALLIAARREGEAGHLARARDLYRQLVALAPARADARAELARIDLLLAGGGADPGQVAPDTELARQIAEAEARETLARIGQLSQAGRHVEAVRQLELGRERMQQVDRTGKAAAALASIDHELDSERQAIADDQRRVQSQERADHLDQASQQAQAVANLEDSRLDERIARINDLRARQFYEVALQHARKLLSERPGDARIEALFGDLLEKVHQQRKLDWKEREKELRQEVLLSIERSLIPTGFDGLPGYPVDWAERHTGRNALESEPAEPEWKLAIQDRLATRVSFDFLDQNAVDALRTLAMQAGVNLIIAPAVASGAERLVTLRARNMRLDSALTWITRALDTKWAIDREAVWVGPTEDIDGVLRLHDIAGLTWVGKDNPGRVIGYSSASGAGGAGGFSLFTGGAAGGAGDVKGTTPEEVVDLLKRSVSPETWQNPKFGIEIRGNLLYVTAPVTAQRLIREFIRAQSSQRNLQVKVDARWITISDGYLEEIGVRWGNAQPLLLTGSRDGVFFTNSHTQSQGSTNNPLPASAITQQPPLASTGMDLHVINIGTPEVSSILHAAEMKTQSQVLASPTLTTLNGVRASCFFGQQVAYIADYDIVGGTYDPKIEVLNLGAALDIKPFVSADHKYVTMDFREAIATATFFTELLQAPRVVNGRIIGAAQILDANGNVIAQVGGTLFGYPLELPNVLLKEISTTIRVPDRGTVLVGGFGHTIEQTTTSQIPFLANIPFIGRLFGNRGRYSQRSQLYVLATVHVLSYDELEAKL